ncbi:hypothetical protein EIP91_000359 [Steccherinum ochraceum]|uniref:F-box domain-containing protein n=1 Tax=Steccherinum ochraceum TaxID=92696 RepID=A0A4R0RFV7_9APHY|nr:hypothetical protein EIP91_000359 [Steccherinum ochraceum]
MPSQQRPIRLPSLYELGLLPQPALPSPQLRLRLTRGLPEQSKQAEDAPLDWPQAIPGSPENYDQTTQDIRTLVACALTCRAWRDLAQKVLKKLEPSCVVVLRSGADLAALPRTDSYRRSISDLIMDPASETDQGWVTAALLILMPKLDMSCSLRLYNINMQAQHPSFYRAWSLVNASSPHPSPRIVVIGGIQNTSCDRIGHLFRHFDDVTVDFAKLEGMTIDSSPRSLDASPYDLADCRFTTSQSDCTPRSSSRPRLPSVPIEVTFQIYSNRQWSGHPRLAASLNSMFSRRPWRLDLIATIHFGNHSLNSSEDQFLSFLQHLPHLHALYLECATLAPPEDPDLWSELPVRLQLLRISQCGMNLRRMAWLCTIMKFRELDIDSLQEEQAQETSQLPNAASFNLRYSLSSLETLNSLILSAEILTQPDFCTFLRLFQPANVTSLNFQLEMFLFNEVVFQALDTLLRCTGSSLKHMSLRLSGCGQEEFRWICANLADRPSTMARIDVRFDPHRSPEGKDVFLSPVDWSLLEPALMVDDLEDIVTFQTPQLYNWAEPALNYRRLKAHLTQFILPTLYRQGRLRFSGEAEDMYGGNEQENVEIDTTTMQV